jgi:catechol 2,3-dioxygenase-like lactoylglutathione lyase family enzyme
MTVIPGSAKIFSYIPTKNFERAKTFYGDVLGLKHVSTDDFALVFESGGIRIRIVRVSEFKPGPIAVVGWQVDDLEKCVTALKAHGVICERWPGIKQDAAGIWDELGRPRVAWFKDPDGNVLSFSAQ